MKDFNTLTRAEMLIMNILWDKGCGMTTHEIIDAYPEPHPAYSTIATFMKILTHKQYVSSYKRDGGGKTYVFSPLITRAEYTRHAMKEVKKSFFGGSLHSLISFFVKEENISDEELEEILSLIDKGTEKRDNSKTEEL